MTRSGSGGRCPRWIGWATAIALMSTSALADDPATIYHDDFSEDLGAWEYWSSNGSARYQLGLDGSDGTPAPPASKFGMQKRFGGNEIGKQFFLQFDWRASSGDPHTSHAGAPHGSRAVA